MTGETNETGRANWQCPHCNHSLAFPETDEQAFAAKLAIVSHMTRCHGMTGEEILALFGEDIGSAVETYFGEPASGDEFDPDGGAGFLRFSP